MPCCAPPTAAVDRVFDSGMARRELRRFRRGGLHAWTRQMVAAIEDARLPHGSTLLDVGGGVGGIHHVLLDRGFSHATQIDASSAFLAAAEDETERIGHAGRVAFRHGDFRDEVGKVAAADVVTLDRVVCCDPDFETMLGGAAQRARRLVAFTYPRPYWITRVFIALWNRWRGLMGDTFRAYVHPPEEMDAVLERAGFHRRWAGGTLVWAAEVYER